MVNPDSTASTSEARQDRLIAGFTALAVAIHVLEAAFPMPLPGVKPGLANIVTLIVLLRHGWRCAVWVGLLRVLVSSILLGTFLTPTFILSFSGALTSLGILGVAYCMARRWLGPVGYAVLAALAHMGGQLLVAYALFIPHPVLLKLAPLLLAFAMGLGIVSGMICLGIVRKLPAPIIVRT